MNAQTCLAVDYGTTNTVAVLRSDSFVNRVKFGNDWRLPSAVFWDDAGPVVGLSAQRSSRMDPTRFIRCPKREMGYETVPLAGKLLPVADVVAASLTEVRSEVHRQLGRDPDRVVLTWPVQWAAQRRQLFQRAVASSGFRDARFLEEPVAAAIRVGGLDKVPVNSPFAVLDFGGGTLDVSVLMCAGSAFDVLACDGADPLGGEDIDDLLFERAVDALGDAPDAVKLRQSADSAWLRNRADLRDACRQAKEQLSEMPWGMIGYPGNKHPELTLTRAEFDGIAGDVLARAVDRLRVTVVQAGYEPTSVPVYLVGGSSRIPALSERIHRELGAPVRSLGDAQFAVSEGAAMWAAGQPGAQRGLMVYLQGRKALLEYQATLTDLAQRAQDRVNDVMKDPGQLVKQARGMHVPGWVWLVVGAVLLLLLIVAAG